MRCAGSGAFKKPLIVMATSIPAHTDIDLSIRDPTRTTAATCRSNASSLAVISRAASSTTFRHFHPTRVEYRGGQPTRRPRPQRRLAHRLRLGLERALAAREECLHPVAMSAAAITRQSGSPLAF